MFYQINKKELDLLAAYNRKEGPSSALKVVKVVIAPVVIVLVLCVSLFFINKKNDSIQALIDMMNVKNQALQYQLENSDMASYEESQKLQIQKEVLSKVNEQIKNYPQLSQQKIYLLYNLMYEGMDILSITFDQATGVISLNMESDYVTYIQPYIKALKNSPGISDVQYSGYNAKTSNESSSLPEVTTYSFSLGVVLGGE